MPSGAEASSGPWRVAFLESIGLVNPEASVSQPHAGTAQLSVVADSWHPVSLPRVHYLATLVLVVVASQALAFDISYRYELLEGKAHEVCRHMLGVYNKQFVKPWSSEGRGQADGSEVFAETRFSRYPSSPEFDAIKWQAHPYKVNKNQHSALYAEFDIDNDGARELIVHVGFFDGSPGTRDSMWIFSPHAVEFSEFRTHDDFLKRFAEKRRTVLDYPVHQRPFIFKGRTYIHGYTYTPRESPGGNPDEPFAPPEYLLIAEYLGVSLDAQERKLKRGGATKLICKYRMIQKY